MATKQQIALAAKLYQCRDAARTLSGNAYAETVIEWMAAVKAIADVLGIGVLQAGQKVVAEMASRYDGPGMMWAACATVELIEPDELTPKMETRNG